MNADGKGPEVRELISQILSSPESQTQLQALMDSGQMLSVLPELVELNGPRGAQDPKYHPEGNTWVHSLLVLSEMKKLHAEHGRPRFWLAELWAALLHDMGKPGTQEIFEDGGISNVGHAELGAQMWLATAARLKFDAQESDLVHEMILHHMLMHNKNNSAEEVKRLIGGKHGQSKIRLQHADALGTANPNRFRRTLREFYLRQLELWDS